MSEYRRYYIKGKIDRMGRFFTKPAETARAGCSAGRAGRIHPHGTADGLLHLPGRVYREKV